MSAQEASRPAPVLDPVDRASEVVFGTLMAVTFTGSLSVATAGAQEVRTMLVAALGCNLAWGLTDAVMYLVRTSTERRRKVNLLQRVRETRDGGQAHRLIADALPERLAAVTDTEMLEALRARLVAEPVPSPGLRAGDYTAALGVFVLVVLATFPVVVPFLFIADASTALRVSNALALATLFVSGHTLGRYAGGSAWRYGLGMMTIGVALIVAIMALGG
jgi:VIT1/CCC1 family predicted Fe2+/Mn2+ transporter